MKQTDMSSLTSQGMTVGNWLLALPNNALENVCLHLDIPARTRLTLTCKALRNLVNNATDALRFTPQNTVFPRGKGPGTKSRLAAYFPPDLPERYPSVNKIAFEGWDLKECKGNSHEAVVLHIAMLPWRSAKQLILTGSTVSPALVTCIALNLLELESVTFNAEGEPEDAHSTPACLQVGHGPLDATSVEHLTDL